MKIRELVKGTFMNWKTWLKNMPCVRMCDLARGWGWLPLVAGHLQNRTLETQSIVFYDKPIHSGTLKRLRWILPAVLCMTAPAGMNAAEPVEKPRIAVFDFTTIDIQGQKFYDFTDRKEVRSQQESLTDADRETIDEEMLGLVKMIDATEEARERQHDDMVQDAQNAANRASYRALADKIMKSPVRSVVIGSEMMTAALGQFDSIVVIDRKAIERAMLKAEMVRSGVRNTDPLGEFRKTAGATHVLYGTVTDFKVRETRFKGYGVETGNMVYSLDVLVKVVELSSGRVVFADSFTGQEKVLKTEFSEKVDSDRFQILMKDAIRQAAIAIDKRFTNADGRPKVVSEPLKKVTVAPRSDVDGEPIVVEVYVDGKFQAMTPCEVELAPGMHRFELLAGSNVRAFDLDIAGGETLGPVMSGPSVKPAALPPAEPVQEEKQIVPEKE